MTSGRGGGPGALLVVTGLIAAASPWIELPEMPFAERCVLLCVVSIGAALAVVLSALDGSKILTEDAYTAWACRFRPHGLKKNCAL